VPVSSPYLYAPADNNAFGNYLKQKFSGHEGIYLLMDENTKKHCKGPLLSMFPELETAKEILIPAGEQQKSLETCNNLWLKLIANHADRHSLLINLGGGVITDLGGFAAASYKRGIAFCNIPTTLLGMIDAAIGGKTGLDYEGMKNIIGSFSFAEKTFINPGFLRTLPERQLKSGFSELLKIVLIADKAFWKKLKPLKYPDTTDQPDLIKKAVGLKCKIVSEDPLEKNVRKKLNFGHTIGHAVESYSMMHDKKPLLHGEAVAIGIICESWISMRECGLPESQLREIQEKITSACGKQKFKFEKAALISFIKNDKKNKKGKNNFTLLPAIGEACIDNFLKDEVIVEALDYYNSL